MSYSVIACLPAARHQNAAAVIMQQVLITLSAGRHAMAYLFKYQYVRGLKKAPARRLSIFQMEKQLVQKAPCYVAFLKP
jgi:hypothetical protein